MGVRPMAGFVGDTVTLGGIVGCRAGDAPGKLSKVGAVPPGPAQPDKGPRTYFGGSLLCAPGPQRSSRNSGMGETDSQRGWESSGGGEWAGDAPIFCATSKKGWREEKTLGLGRGGFGNRRRRIRGFQVKPERAVRGGKWSCPVFWQGLSFANKTAR